MDHSHSGKDGHDSGRATKEVWRRCGRSMKREKPPRPIDNSFDHLTTVHLLSFFAQPHRTVTPHASCTWSPNCPSRATVWHIACTMRLAPSAGLPFRSLVLLLPFMSLMSFSAVGSCRAVAVARLRTGQRLSPRIGGVGKWRLSVFLLSCLLSLVFSFLSFLTLSFHHASLVFSQPGTWRSRWSTRFGLPRRRGLRVVVPEPWV